MYRNFMSLPLLGESMLPHPTILPERMTRINKCAKFILLTQKIQIYTGGKKLINTQHLNIKCHFAGV